MHQPMYDLQHEQEYTFPTPTKQIPQLWKLQRLLLLILWFERPLELKLINKSSIKLQKFLPLYLQLMLLTQGSPKRRLKVVKNWILKLTRLHLILQQEFLHNHHLQLLVRHKNRCRAPIVSYFVISGSALMSAFAAPCRILVNIAGSEDTCAMFPCDSSGVEGIKWSFPERFHAETFPVHPSAVVFASSAESTVLWFLKFDRLRRVNDTPGPFNAVINAPT